MYEGNPGEIEFDDSSYRGFELLGVDCISLESQSTLTWRGEKLNELSGGFLSCKVFKCFAQCISIRSRQNRTAEQG